MPWLACAVAITWFCFVAKGFWEVNCLDVSCFFWGHLLVREVLWLCLMEFQRPFLFEGCVLRGCGR